MAESRRVLIVEDEEGIAIHLSSLLKRMNCEPVGMVTFGEEAVEQAGRLHPDLVLMDIHLAGKMDGTEAARLIHQEYGTPIIFLSALTGERVLNQAEESEPFAYLIKPIQEPDLRAAIDVALYKHRMEARLRDSERRYRMLFETMTSAFALGEVTCDDDGHPIDYHILAVNPAFEQMTGIHEGRLDGGMLNKALPSEAAQALIARFGRVAQEGGSDHFEVTLPALDRSLNFTIYSPQPGQFAAIIEDISDRRHSEKQLRESYTRQERTLKRMTILRNIDQSITTHTSQASMAEAILSEIVTPGEIDAAVLFLPNTSGPGRVRGTGPLSQLRLAGLAGVPEALLDSSVLNWQMINANHVFTTHQPLYLNDLSLDSHPGAQMLNRLAGFKSSSVLPLAARGQVKGVLQFLHRQAITTDLDGQTFLQSLALQTAIGIDHVEMLENLQRSNRELVHAYEETIKGWAQALELRDLETRGHADRVEVLTEKLAVAMGIQEPELTHIRHGALLHDVGKMAIPDQILRKTGKLSDEEWVTMRLHTTKAYEMLYPIEYLRPALDVVYSHHEKWDGTGYPRGLKGEEIPLSARIFAVVDVWDALTSDRKYRLAWPPQEARNYIIQQSGKHFDPHVVEVFLKIMG